MIALGDIAVRRNGSIDPKKHQGETFELFSIPAFDAGASDVVVGAKIGSSKQCVQTNDVMISKIVPHIRRAWVVGPSKGPRQIASGEWIVFRSEAVWPQYLRWVLVNDTFHSAFMKTVSGVGGSLLRARPKEVFKIKIPVPPLPEQKRIAGILDAADALRAKRRESLAQLDALLQSTFLDLFGDPVTNPKGWEMIPIGTLVKVMGGFAFKSSDFSQTGFPVVRISNLNEDSVDITNCARIPASALGKGSKFRIKAGDTLIAMSGATTGKLGFVPESLTEEWYLNQRVGAFRVPRDSKIVQRFLRSILQSPFYQEHVWNLAGGAAQPNIGGKQLEAALIPLPPLDLQHRFAGIVESIEAQKARYRAQLAELDTLFASLQHRAFNGEL